MMLFYVIIVLVVVVMVDTVDLCRGYVSRNFEVSGDINSSCDVSDGISYFCCDVYASCCGGIQVLCSRQ